MSLIADSLKKAIRERTSESKLPPEFNVVANKPASGSARLGSLLRFLLLILIPTGILIYLVEVGAFKFRTASKTVSSKVSPPLESLSAKVTNTPAPAEIAVAKIPAPRAQTVESSKLQKSESPAALEKPVAQKYIAAPPKPLRNVPRTKTPSSTLHAPYSGAKTQVQKQVPASNPASVLALAPIETLQSETQGLLPDKIKTVNKQTASAIKPIERVEPAQKIPGVKAPETVFSHPEAITRISPEPAPKVGLRPVEKAPLELEELKMAEAAQLKAAVSGDSRKARERVAEVSSGLNDLNSLPTLAALKKTAPVELQENENKTELNEAAPVSSAFTLAEIQILTPPASQELFQNGDYYFNRALFFQQAQEWEKALASYSNAARLDPENADTYNNKGVIYKELGQYDRAVDEFLRAVFLKPDYGKAYNNIGVVYYLQKKYEEAVRNYQKAIEIDASNLEAFNNLAIVYKNKNELLKAKAVLNRALALNPEHPGINYNLAVLYDEAGETLSALHYYRRFLEVGVRNHPSLVLEVKKHVRGLEQK